MAGETVLNVFKQTPGPLGSMDNEFVMGGTVSSPGGVNLKTIKFTVKITDLSTAEEVPIAPGFSGTVVSLTASYSGSPGAGGTLTSTIDGVAITDGDIVLLGGRQYQVFTATPTALNTFSSTQSISIQAPGGDPTGGAASVTVEVLPD